MPGLLRHPFPREAGRTAPKTASTRRPAFAAVAIVLLLLAGCSAEPKQSSTPARPPSGPTDSARPPLGGSHPPGGTGSTNTTRLAPVVAIKGCQQWHTFFPFPSALFADGAPEGFTVASDNEGSTTSVYLNWELCGNLTALRSDGLRQSTPSSASLLVGLPVTAPPEYANASVQLDLVPLLWVVDTDPAMTWLSVLNDTLVHRGQLSRSGSLNAGVHGDSIDAVTADGSFHMDSFVATQAAPFDAWSSRVWLVHEHKVHGFVQIDNAASQQIGEGSATVAFDGPLLAGPPPGSQGTSHAVEQVDVRWTPHGVLGAK